MIRRNSQYTDNKYNTGQNQWKQRANHCCSLVDLLPQIYYNTTGRDLSTNFYQIIPRSSNDCGFVSVNKNPESLFFLDSCVVKFPQIKYFFDVSRKERLTSDTKIHEQKLFRHHRHSDCSHFIVSSRIDLKILDML